MLAWLPSVDTKIVQIPKLEYNTSNFDFLVQKIFGHISRYSAVDKATKFSGTGAGQTFST